MSYRVPTIDQPAEVISGAEREERRWQWLLVGGGLIALLAVLATILSLSALAASIDDDGASVAATAAPEPATAAGAPTIEDAEGVDFEPFERVDPNLPAVPAGDVKRFDVDVYHHVTQVSAELAPTEVWSYSVNGKEHRGSGYSEPMVVEVGDTVDFKLTNGSGEAMQVTLPHSMDFHSAEVNPGERYADLSPGETMRYRFTADHPGVFMYHCATQPVLMHTGAGMVGAMIVKPKGLEPARDLMVTQQEYYIGEPGGQADMEKMKANEPDVIAFNGYANQYADEPIAVKRGERIRMWLLNAGPSVWSAFHVIGTVFDKTVIEGVEGEHAQTVNLAPSQGGYVEFTLAEEGTYPFVNHSFGNMVKGSLGILKTENAPAGAGHSHGAPAHGDEGHDHATDHGQDAAADADVNVKMGEMYIKTDKTEVKAGKIKFAVTNEGATMHGMALALTPVNESGGMLDDKALIGKGADLAAGDEELIEVDLKPGKYELVCFVPGHYAAGQKLAFEVTS
jgi:nitrite reductase (NO-forming)